MLDGYELSTTMVGALESGAEIDEELLLRAMEHMKTILEEVSINILLYDPRCEMYQWVI